MVNADVDFTYSSFLFPPFSLVIIQIQISLIRKNNGLGIYFSLCTFLFWKILYFVKYFFESFNLKNNVEPSFSLKNS